MEHISAATGIDSVDLRLRNLLKEGDKLLSGGNFKGKNPLHDMVDSLKSKADFNARCQDIEKFNEVRSFPFYVNDIITLILHI